MLLDALHAKDEFKARGLSDVAGDDFTVTASEQISGRIDTKGRQGAARRAVQRVRKGHHLHRDPHQGCEPARARGVTIAPRRGKPCRHSPETGRAVALSPNLSKDYPMSKPTVSALGQASM